MEQPILTQATLVTTVQALVTAILADTPKLRLFTDGPAPLQQRSALGDFTQPSGTWYTAKDAPVGAAWIDSGGTIHFSVTGAQWDYSGSSAAETIKGAMVSGTSEGLITYWWFDNPITMGALLDSVVTDTIQLDFPPVTGTPGAP